MRGDGRGRDGRALLGPQHRRSRRRRAAARRLLWVPRDLWCAELGQRVNKAYALGGHEQLIGALSEHEIAAEHSVCLRPDGIRPALEGVAIRVPVREELELRFAGEWMRFDPPDEDLSGERIHGWIGGRQLRGEASQGWLPDLDRIARQQELVAMALADGLDFARFLESGLPVQVSDPAALDELSGVRWDWAYATLDVTPAEMQGKEVLLRAPAPR